MDNSPILRAKTDFIQSLEKVRLVIGNGFDLYCGLKTKYSDYFEHDKEKNEKLGLWVDNISEGQLIGHLDYINQGPQSQYAKQYSRRLPSVGGLNIWDLVFYLASCKGKFKDELRWCDIEEAMNQALSKSFHNVFKLLSLSQTVSKLPGAILEQAIGSKNPELVQLAAFVHKQRNECFFKDEQHFYDYLLNQLMLFEQNFGQYINGQIFNTEGKAFGVVKFSESFRTSCRKTIENLCSPDHLVGIDTFNYGTIKPKHFEELLHHINGDVTNPIFGIDSSGIDPGSPEYIFTKTYRRMILDAKMNACDERRLFENAVIFGHSLCSFDYNYFFPLLDRLRLTDFTRSFKIVFAYCIYDQNRPSEIRSTLFKGVSKLFKEYAESKGIKDSSRLLDSLTTQGRVLLFELEPLNCTK